MSTNNRRFNIPRRWISCKENFLLLAFGIFCCLLESSEAFDFFLGDKDVVAASIVSTSKRGTRRTTGIPFGSTKSYCSFVPLSKFNSKTSHKNPPKICHTPIKRNTGIETKQQQASLVSLSLWKQINTFIRERTGDFVKLENSDDEFGPGPLIILYGCPEGINDDELRDMIEDGAPAATKTHGTVIFGRVPLSDDHLLDSTVSNALERIVKDGEIKTTAASMESAIIPFPVIYFSGISNKEMMQTYKIIAEEIYQETGGAAKSACAKVVEPAMGKTLREVFEQITGDHQDAVSGSEPQ